LVSTAPLRIGTEELLSSAATEEVNIAHDPLNPSHDTALEDFQIFNARFDRCRKLLVFIAGRVLTRQESIEEAMYNCWRVASRNPPRLEHEGAFRSWLVRVLLDQAFVIHRRRRNRGYSDVPAELLG